MSASTGFLYWVNKMAEFAEYLLALLLMSLFVFVFVLGIIGIVKGAKREIVVFTTKKDMLYNTICTGSVLPLFLLGYVTFITFFIAFGCLVAAIIYNIRNAYEFGSTAWERWLIFSARSLLGLISAFIITQLIYPPQSKNGADGVDRIAHNALWAGAAMLYYKWLMRFVKEQQIGNVKVII